MTDMQKYQLKAEKHVCKIISKKISKRTRKNYNYIELKPTWRFANITLIKYFTMFGYQAREIADRKILVQW